MQQSESGLFVDPSGRRPPFRRLVPLEEVIAHALGRGPSTKGVRTIYDQLIAHVGTESHIIQHATLDAIAAIAKESVALGVIAAREGRVTIEPGYDGVYGTVRSA